MEITIGVQHAARELSLETDMTSEQVSEAFAAALAGEKLLELTDTRGRRLFVPATKIAYLEIGPEETRRVGFGSL